MIHSPFSPLFSVTRQVWAIPNVFEIACGRDRLPVVPDHDDVTTRDREIPTAPLNSRYWKRAVGKPVSPHVVGRLFGIRKPQRSDFSYTTGIFHVLVLL